MEGGQLEDLGIDGTIMIEWALKKSSESRGVDRFVSC
jgi:hypothetical protein